MGEIATVLSTLLTDLRNNAGLPALTTAIYGREPREVLPEETPALAVIWAGDQAGFLTTDQISEEVAIEIRYYEEAVVEAQTLIVDQTKAVSLIDAADKIFHRLITLWKAGGFAGAWQLRPVPGRRGRDLKFGLVEGVSVGAVADIIYS